MEVSVKLLLLWLDAEAGRNLADCICYSDASQDDTNQLIDVLARRWVYEDVYDAPLHPNSNSRMDNGTHSIVSRSEILVQQAALRTCPAINVRIPDYSKTAIIAYYDVRVNCLNVDKTLTKTE